MKKCYSIADIREKARRTLPRVIFDFIDGAAEDEVTLARNSSGFMQYDLVPRTLVDVSDINLSTTIQGVESSLPLIFSPTGGNRLFHHQGELAVSSVAEEQEMIYSLSTMSTHSIETVSKHSKATKWFQVYVWKDREVVKEFLARCRSSGYHALILTVDVQTSGQRERDLRNGFTLPPKFTLSSLIDMGLHPNWWWNTLTKPQITLSNMIGKGELGVNNSTALGKYAASQLDPSVTFDDLAWMIQEWGGPFMVKGITNAEDAARVVDCGATGIMISNHGGRQLDHAIAPIDALPSIVNAVGDRTEVYLDGGVRRGTDIIKALALGADACMIGRPYLYGLAAGGKAGVSRSIELLREELKRSMMLMGCTDIANLDQSYLHKR